MQAPSDRQSFATMLTALAVLLGGSACGTADDPYARIADRPLVQAQLHAITLVSGSDAVAARIRAAGYQPVKLAANYPRAITVEASLWDVSEAMAASVQDFKSPRPEMPDLRLLVDPDFDGGSRGAPARLLKSFFRNVLGADVPVSPLPPEAADQARVQVLTYLVPDVVAVARRLRDSGLGVNYGPVGLTTAYLGDHRTVAIRAPDGVVVQLVQTAAQ